MEQSILRVVEVQEGEGYRLTYIQNLGELMLRDLRYCKERTGGIVFKIASDGKSVEVQYPYKRPPEQFKFRKGKRTGMMQATVKVDLDITLATITLVHW